MDCDINDNINVFQFEILIKKISIIHYIITNIKLAYHIYDNIMSDNIIVIIKLHLQRTVYRNRYVH